MSKPARQKPAWFWTTPGRFAAPACLSMLRWCPEKAAAPVTISADAVQNVGEKPVVFPSRLMEASSLNP